LRLNCGESMQTAFGPAHPTRRDRGPATLFEQEPMLVSFAAHGARRAMPLIDTAI